MKIDLIRIVARDLEALGHVPGEVDADGEQDRLVGAVLGGPCLPRSEGVLGVGCHGPGAPDGILEGVIATKGYVTYWDGQAPVGGVDANRTLFHVR